MEIHPHSKLENIIKAYDEQIAYHEDMAKRLRLSRQMTIDNPPPPVYFFQANPHQLTKDLIRKFMRQIKKPMRTVEVIDSLYPTATEEVKNKAVKTLSVIFNTLEKDRQIKVEKTPGVKGNLYTWIEEDTATLAAGAGMA